MASTNRLQHIIHSLVEYRKLWLFPAIVGLVLATGYAFFLKGESWTARQTMIIRDDLLGQNFKPGSFLSEEAMKSAQETVLETARRPEVIRATLEKLGPSRKSLFGLGGVPASWPSDKTIEEMRGEISFESANGGEFGKSEVIVLAAKASNADRSVQLLSILTEEIDRKLAEIRADRFSSMEAELEATCASALKSTRELTNRVTQMEASMGQDVSIIRSISGPETGGSPSAFDTQQSEIDSERRAAIRRLAAARAFKRTLERAQRSPDTDLPTSAEMLASQPSLAGLVENLAKARQALSIAESKYTARHGSVENGKNQVESMKRQIKEAIGPAIKGVENQIAMFQEQVDTAESQLGLNNQKLQGVGGQRGAWMTLQKQLQKRTDDFTEATTKLAQVRSRKDASGSIQLLTKIGEPWVGTKADGMGKRAMSLIGGIGGLFIGLGLVMIVAPPFTDPELARLEQSGGNVDFGGSQNDIQSTHESNEPVSQQQQMPSVPAPVPPQRTPTPPAAPVIQTPASPVVQAPISPVPISAPTAPVSVPAEAVATKPVEQPVEQQIVQTPVAHQPQSVTPTPRAPVAQPASESSNSDAVLDIGAAPLNVQPRENSMAETVASTQTEASAKTDAPSRPVAPPAPQPQVTATPASASLSFSAIEAATTKLNQQTAAESPVQQEAPKPLPTPPKPPARPVSKTLAAIFANMPQPRTDATVVPSVPAENSGSETETAQMIVDKIESLTNELKDTSQTNAAPGSSDRPSTETIQLDGNQPVLDGALPLQRRTSVRPVDLAKVYDDVDEDEGGDGSDGMNRQMIDNAFSQFKSPQVRIIDDSSGPDQYGGNNTQGV